MGRAHQLLRALDDPLEHVLEPFRGGEVAAELEQRLGALGLASLHLVEPGVLDRGRRVAGEHLEQAQVVVVELIETELRDDDHADHAGAVVHRHGDDRLLDLRGALDLDRELAGRGVVEEERLAGLDDAAGEPLADAGRGRPPPLVRSGAVSSPWKAIGCSSSPSRTKMRQLW